MAVIRAPSCPGAKSLYLQGFDEVLLFCYDKAMKTPLALGDSEIIHAINGRFSTDVTDLDFLPVGESSWIYVASDGEDHRSIIKAQEELNPATEEVLELLRSQDYKWMPQVVVSAAGHVWENIGSLYYSVQQYIGSVSLNHANSKPDDTYLRTVGAMLKDLHGIQFNEMQLQHVDRENFDSPLIAHAQAALEAIARQTEPTEAVRAVQSCFDAQAENIDQLFSNLARYGSDLRDAQPRLVLTHGDVHFGNIIEPSDDHLYLVDWDEASISLPAMDFKYFSDEQLAVISDGYGQNLLADRLQLQYYRNLLMVRALWFWPTKLLAAPIAEQGAIAKTTIDIFSLSPYFVRALAVLS